MASAEVREEEDEAAIPGERPQPAGQGWIEGVNASPRVDRCREHETKVLEGHLVVGLES